MISTRLVALLRPRLQPSDLAQDVQRLDWIVGEHVVVQALAHNVSLRFDAIHSCVPEELWPEILCKIDGPVAADTPAEEIEDGDDAEDEYDR